MERYLSMANSYFSLGWRSLLLSRRITLVGVRWRMDGPLEKERAVDVVSGEGEHSEAH
jgi:hypothetical protein